ncbi:hypothetical protein L195_g036124 [Trifolium pratense]|uniref:Uncharacterized protein n=1 Tax=Trifolium pratense TaxID=57577 RepID=A0A2K3LNL5_TRIPR|nr:hypothetical protein L195_g036124 [Trifolium pratense]
MDLYRAMMEEKVQSILQQLKKEQRRARSSQGTGNTTISGTGVVGMALANGNTLLNA